MRPPFASQRHASTSVPPQPGVGQAVENETSAYMPPPALAASLVPPAPVPSSLSLASMEQNTEPEAERLCACTGEGSSETEFDLVWLLSEAAARHTSPQHRAW